VGRWWHPKLKGSQDRHQMEKLYTMKLYQRYKEVRRFTPRTLFDVSRKDSTLAPSKSSVPFSKIMQCPVGLKGHVRISVKLY
jgi:hypothetical protein